MVDTKSGVSVYTKAWGARLVDIKTRVSVYTKARVPKRLLL